MKKVIAILVVVAFLVFGSTALSVSANNGSEGLPGNVVPSGIDQG